MTRASFPHSAARFATAGSRVNFSTIDPVTKTTERKFLFYATVRSHTPFYVFRRVAP